MPAQIRLIERSSRQEIARRLRISITDSCNFRCFFCHNEGQGPLSVRNDKMSVAEIVKIIDIAYVAGVRAVKLTGGEPLIYRYNAEGIVDLVSAITAQMTQKQRRLNLSLITNGYLLPKFALPLRAAGLERITVSLSTLNPGTFTTFIGRPGSGDSSTRVVEGIRAAIQAGFHPIKVNTVLFCSKDAGGNVSEIPAIIRLCRNLGIQELRLYTLLWHPEFTDFEEFSAYWDTQLLRDSLWSELIEEDPSWRSCVMELNRISATESKYAYPKPRVVVNYDGLDISFETMMPGRFRDNPLCDDCEFPELCQEGAYAIRLSANGELRGCLLSNGKIDLLSAMRNGGDDDTLFRLFEKSGFLLPKE